MKIFLNHNHSSSRRGFAVVVMLIILTIMVALLAANHSAVSSLEKRISLINKKQIERTASPGKQSVK